MSRAWKAPSTARPTSRPTMCSRSGPASRRCPNGSTAALGTTRATVRNYRAELPGSVEGGFQPGGHDASYWRSILPDVLSFLGRNLG